MNYSSMTTTFWKDCFILSLLIFVLFGSFLGSYGFFIPDEGRYGEIAREMMTSGNWVLPVLNGGIFFDKPILLYWLAAGALRWLGPQEWAVRLVPMLMGWLGCLATYWAGRQLFNRRVGMLAAIIMASSVLYFFMAHYFNTDLLVAVWISLALLTFIVAIQKYQGAQRRLCLLIAYACAGVAVLAKGLIGIVFPLMIIGAWIALTQQWRLLRNMQIFSGFMIFLVIVCPWFYLAGRAQPQFWHYFLVVEHWQRFTTQHFNNPMPVWFYVPVVLIGFMPWTLFLPQALYVASKQWLFAKIAPSAESAQQNTMRYLLLWPFLIVLFFSMPHSKIISYILPAWPALALLTAHYLVEYWEQAKAAVIRWPVMLWAIASIILGPLMILTINSITPLQQLATLPYFYVLAIFAMLGGIALLITLKQPKLMPILFTLTLMTALGSLTAMASLSKLHFKASRPLALIIQTHLQPQDIVAIYDTYYSDLPFYLQRPVKVVANWQDPNLLKIDNWRRDLGQSTLFGGNPNLILPAQFFALWKGPQRVYLLLNRGRLNEIAAQLPHAVQLGEYQHILLLTNR